MKIIAWCLRHKEALELFGTLIGAGAAVLLGAMALILTSNSNKTAAAQLQVAARELTLSEVQAKPRFRLLWKHLPDPDDSAKTFEALEVWNDGPPFLSFGVIQHSFLEVRSLNQRALSVKHVPVYYLHNRAFTGEASGLLVTMAAYRSPPLSRQNINITLKLRELQEELLHEGYRAEIRVLLDVGYSNIYDQKGAAVFEATRSPSDLWFSGPAFAHRIPRQAAAELAHEWFERNLNELTASQILEMLPRQPDLSQWLNAVGDAQGAEAGSTVEEKK